jgi:hypothetical protein
VLPALLDIGIGETLRFGLEHLVDLIQQVVEFCLDLLALLGRGGRLLDDLVLASRGRLLLLLSLSHVP